MENKDNKIQTWVGWVSVGGRILNTEGYYARHENENCEFTWKGKTHIGLLRRLKRNASWAARPKDHIIIEIAGVGEWFRDSYKTKYEKIY